MPRILVVGTGYVGLTTAVGLAEMGNQVTGYDLNYSLIEKLSAGAPEIYEPNLENLLKKGLESNSLVFTSSTVELEGDFEYVFLCLPTPQKLDGSVDLSYLEQALSAIKEKLLENSILFIKSTVPVGTARQIKDLVVGKVEVVSNPEFLREGQAIYDFFNPERVVIGATNQVAYQRAAELFLSLDAPFIFTTHETAELIKYASNAFLALKLSFVNEIAELSERTKVDIVDLLKAIGLDSRIGRNHLQPGPGWGGSCFPKDTLALVRTSQVHEVDLSTIRAAVDSNNRTIRRSAKKIAGMAGYPGNTKIISIMGLAFKANTGDVRESASFKIAKMLKADGYEIRGYDPVVKESDEFAGTVCETIAECIDGADVIAFLTEWEEFRLLDPEEVLFAMAGKFVYDARLLLDKDSWVSAGAIFESVGFRS